MYKEVDRYDFTYDIESKTDLIVVLNDGRGWAAINYQRL